MNLQPPTPTPSQAPEKFVYFFSKDHTEGRADMKELLGGKGANLAEMCSLGIPVPPGLTIATTVCEAFYKNGKKLPDWARGDVESALARMEEVMGKKFGDPQNPLLVSVRSGARVSMPGMMDTILNLGLNDKTVEGLAQSSGQPRFAWDSYRRFVQMYANVVMGMNSSFLEVLLEDLKEEKGYASDTDLTVEDLKGLVAQFKENIRAATGKIFPEDPKEQLWGAIDAVFLSWNTPRAKTYRRLHNFSESWGTAVNVQAMVFGNMGDSSATGVAFTRNPSTGERAFFGEFLLNAQGEDVVAGIRTPHPLTKADAGSSGVKALEEVMPEAYKNLVDIYQKLERHYRDMQDLEFTVENGQLWMLQTRSGKRTAAAALKIAIDMVKEGLITQEEAILRVSPASLEQLLHPTLDPKAQKTLLAKGLPASPGGAAGQLVFSSEEAVAWKEQGKKVILARIETSPEDIEGMVAAAGILTTRGGMTSHAAVVARGMGKCCVAGCGEAQVDVTRKRLKVSGYELNEGDWITLDGTTGELYLGEVPMREPELGGDFETLMAWADKVRRLKVRANADSPSDSGTARKFGAEGIGLCRTEHMFFGPERIDEVRKMILAEGQQDREMALSKLLPMQRKDFYDIFKVMQGLPVTIRLLDPPLHEFLPQEGAAIDELAKRLSLDKSELERKISSLHEFNPMLGHRGCRLAITYPEIYRMQVRAIAEAAADVVAEGDTGLVPEIMIPLIATKEELEELRALAVEEVEAVQKEKGQSFDYLVGTMIELPRACLVADEVAEVADFFSFGTNDLTQTTLGLSRDDAGKFLSSYVQSGILPEDPFVSIDQAGVGQLVKLGLELGRKVRQDLKIGICGEHGGDPASIDFFHRVGLDYVSCSPFRVPVARLAAAHASLLRGDKVENQKA